MEAIQLDSEAALRKRLRSFPKGIREAVEYLDDGKEIRVKLLTGPDKLRIDFSGSAAVHPGNLNATPAIVTSAVLYVLRLWVDKPVPLNEGLMRVVDLVIPDGMLNPSFSEDPSLCPAVVGGNTETSQRIVDTLLKALGLAACSQGTMNNVLFGNDRFGYYETVGGGVGAIAGSRGADAVHQHMTNTRITDPEILEFRYPVRLEKFAIRKGSGGLGKWNGGNGIERRIRFLEAVDLTLLSQHRVERPYGLEGGLAGEAGMQYIIRKNGNREKLSGIDGRRLEPGDQLVLLTPGGGGYGKPEPHS
jgi:5-oxoprolinase (ATP-hydrolysing)